MSALKKECRVCYQPFRVDEVICICTYCRMPHCTECTNWLDSVHHEHLVFCDDCVEQAAFLVQNHYEEYLRKCSKNHVNPIKQKEWLKEESQCILRILFHGSLCRYDQDYDSDGESCF
jgi:hypothetical protein